MMHPAFVRGYTDAMEKLAVVTEADIASALAGSPSREISDEEIAEYAKQLEEAARERTKRYPLKGMAIGVGPGGALGTLLGRSISRRGPKGALIGGGLGALGGAGLGAGIGALAGAGKVRGEKRWGTTLGEIAQEGRVPRRMPVKTHEALIPYARGIREETAAPLSPEEFSSLKQQLSKELMLERGLEGGLQGGMMGSVIGEGPLSEGALAGSAAGAGLGMLEGRRAARQQAGQVSDLYERGYGHLAGRLLERQ